MLARDKGFEPLTFWSVAMDFNFRGVLRSLKKPYFMLLLQHLLLAVFHLLRRFTARLCGKNAVKSSA